MKVGLLAGKGELPLEFLKSARNRGIETITFALEGIANSEVEKYSNKVIWIKPFKLGKFLKVLKKEKISEIAILGKVEHKSAISLNGFDLKALTFLASLRDRKPETIIKGIISEIEKVGVKVIDPTEYLFHLLPEPGVICGRFTDELKKEAKFGMRIAKEIASLDIGQTVVVKDKTVIAVEGIEGTNRCIERGAELSGKGFIVCKAARKNQDMRVDVPTVGAETVELIGRLKGKALIFEAKKTFLLNRKKVIKIAQSCGITIVAV